jgi:hypothetical protein
MVALGRTLIVLLSLLLILALIFLVGACAAFTGEKYMIISGLVALLVWLLAAGMTTKALWFAVGMARDQADAVDDGLYWANATFFLLTILAPVTGLALAFGAFAACGPLWIANLFHGAGLFATIFGFLLYFSLPWIVRTCGVVSDKVHSHGWGWIVFMPLLVAVIWGLAWLIPYMVLKGNIDETKSRTAGYKLPFPKDEEGWVIQGNNSGSNHSGKQQYAWDFRRSCGSPVLAARGGTIVTDPAKTRDNYTGNGSDKPNNFITIDQGDGTFGRYLHIQQGSILRRSGTVKQGTEIAKVGNVGNSLTGHIHFVVEDKDGNSLPVKFDLGKDDKDKGIPRTFHSYTSSNNKVP